MIDSQTGWSKRQRDHLLRLIRTGATIAYVVTDQHGRPCNGGTNTRKNQLYPGLVQEVKGPLELGTARALHGTYEPHRWSGCRVWVAGFVGEIARDKDEIAALCREIVGEVFPECAFSASVGVRIGRKDLAGEDLRGAYLANADFLWANLERANLAGADLSRAYLAGANLAGTDLSGACVMNARLDGAKLARAYLAGANFQRVDFRQADLAWADLTEANLAHADLAGADLTEANLAHADLSGVNLAGAKLSGANLLGAKLAGVNLT
jgi:uncharacterized protein YjbI with pentapeptide repeats